MNQGVLAHAEEHSKGTHTHTKKLPITPFKYLKVSLRAHRYFESELFRRKKKKFPDPRSSPDLLIQSPAHKSWSHRISKFKTIQRISTCQSKKLQFKFTIQVF